MSTVLQQKLARVIVESLTTDNPPNKTEMLESVGYATTTALHEQSRTIESKGVQEELISLGFSEDSAKRVVATILTNVENEPRDRLKAAEMIFKVNGSFAPVKTVNLNMNETIADPELDKFRTAFNDAAKKRVIDQINEL